MVFACSHRIRADELIDQPETSYRDIGDNLRDLAAINRWLGGAHATLAHAFPILRACGSNPVRVLDAGCGGGDSSRYIVDEARRLGRRVEVTALDLNERVLEWARDMSRGYPEITFVHANVLAPPLDLRGFDMVILATFIHHLEPEQVITVLQVARSVSRGHVIVSDLVRSRFAYLGYWILSRVAQFSPVSVRDGGVSVLRAYTPSELEDLARAAGLGNWRLHRHRLYRMTLVYEGAHCGKGAAYAHE